MAEKKKKLDYQNPGKKPWIALGALSAVIILMVVAVIVVWKYAMPEPLVMDVEEIELRSQSMDSGGGDTGTQQPGAGGQPGTSPEGGAPGGDTPKDGAPGGGMQTKPVELEPGETIIGKLLGSDLQILTVAGDYLKNGVQDDMGDPSMMPQNMGDPGMGDPGMGDPSMGGAGGDAGGGSQAYLKGKDGKEPKVFTGRITEKHSNGKQKWGVNVKEGYPHGLVLRWDDEGRVAAKMQYSNGIRKGMTSLIEYDVPRDDVFAVIYKDAPTEFTDAMNKVITAEKGHLKIWIINGEEEKLPESIQVYFTGQLMLWAGWSQKDDKWSRYKILLPWHYNETLGGDEKLPDDERPKEYEKVETPGLFSLKRKNYTALGEPIKEEGTDGLDDGGSTPPDGPGGGTPPPPR